MGKIISRIEEIDSIHWTQLRKGRVQAARRVLAVTDTAVIVELANGTYTVAGFRHAPNGKWAVMGYGLDRFTGAVLDGLVKIGVLTKEQVSAHKKAEQERSNARNTKYSIDRLKEACKQLGIAVPKAAIAKAEGTEARSK